MNVEIKQKLEKLRKENKAKNAKKQLIDDLNNRYHISISNEDFIDYELSESVHKKVYEKIRKEDIIIEKFCYEHDNTNKKLEEIFTAFNHYEDNNILYYPSTFGFNSRSNNQLYLNFPIAIASTIKECRDSIFRLVHEMHDDIIVVDENLQYGFVISEDEYECVIIEYWGEKLRDDFNNKFISK